MIWILGMQGHKDILLAVVSIYVPYTHITRHTTNDIIPMIIHSPPTHTIIMFHHSIDRLDPTCIGCDVTSLSILDVSNVAGTLCTVAD